MSRTNVVARSLALFAIAATALALLAPAARADRLTLRDGRVLEGRIVSESEAGLELELKRDTMVTVLHFARADVKTVERGPVAAAPADPDAIAAELLKVARRAVAALAKGSYLEAVDAVHAFDRARPAAAAAGDRDA